MRDIDLIRFLPPYTEGNHAIIESIRLVAQGKADAKAQIRAYEGIITLVCGIEDVSFAPDSSSRTMQVSQ